MITYFHDEKAFPVKDKNGGSVILLPWGRRKKEKSDLPLGEWVTVESLKEKLFAKYFPKPIKILVKKLLLKNEGDTYE